MQGDLVGAERGVIAWLARQQDDLKTGFRGMVQHPLETVYSFRIRIDKRIIENDWQAVVMVCREDFGHREASVDGAPLELPRRELLVLEALVRRMGRTVLRSALEEAVYSFDDEIQSNALDTHVSRLRRKLAEADAGVEIHGIRGVGYLLKKLS